MGFLVFCYGGQWVWQGQRTRESVLGLVVVLLRAEVFEGTSSWLLLGGLLLLGRRLAEHCQYQINSVMEMAYPSQHWPECHGGCLKTRSSIAAKRVVVEQTRRSRKACADPCRKP